MFHKDTMPLLNYLDNDGKKAEHKWSTNIHNYNLVTKVSNMRQLIQGNTPSSCCPALWNNHYMVHDRITKIDKWQLEIMELPIRV
ncbi:DNA topoisomerase 2-beta [Massospora cicadina]|nr:DNA topoisomerase 2-beta [Massospora cicadina]